MLTVPHVTVPAFKAYPHYLDLDDLRSGDYSRVDQDDELNQQLLAASAWVDDFCDLGPDVTLAAHTAVENVQLRPDRRGRVVFHPEHIPLQQVTGVAWGYDPARMTPVADLSGLWLEDKRRVTLAGLGVMPGMAALQFGAPPNQPLYMTWTYVAGYPSTVLTADAAAGAPAVTVADPTGIVPGTVLRISTPGAEEAVTAASVVGATVALGGPLRNAHSAGDGASAMPTNVLQAVIYCTIALLERGQEAPEGHAPGAKVEPALLSGSVADKEGSGLIGEAERLLEPYIRVR